MKIRSTKASKFLDSSAKKSMLTSFETRLDTCVFRMGFTTSFRQLRQWILHGQVLVNLVPVKNSNYQIEPGDLISIKESHKWSVHQKLLERIKKRNVISTKPQHLEINSKILAGVLLFKPQQIYYPTPARLAKVNRLKTKLPIKQLPNSWRSLKSRGSQLLNQVVSSESASPLSPSFKKTSPLSSLYQGLKKHYKAARRRWRFSSLNNIRRNKKKWYTRTLFRTPKEKTLKFFLPELAIN